MAMKNDRNLMAFVASFCGFLNIHKISLHNYANPDAVAFTGFNAPPPFPTPGSNRKAAKRRSGIQCRHGKAARK